MEFLTAIFFGLFLFFLTRPFTILLHELGHAIPVMILTKQGAVIFIGSYGQKQNSFRIKLGKLEMWFRYNPRRWGGGLCIPLSKDISVNHRIVYILCGPVCSFLIAVLICLLIFGFDMHALWKLIALVICGSTIVDLVSNLIPRTFKLTDGRTFHSDGYQLMTNFKNRKYLTKYREAAKLYEEKDFSNALAIFSQLLKWSTVTEDLYRAAFYCCIPIEEYQKAYETLKEFERRYQLTSDDYCNLAFVYYMLHPKEYGQLYYQKALELNSENIYALNGIGSELFEKKLFIEAIPYLEKAMEINAKFIYPYINRAYIKIELGQLEDAINDLNTAMTLDEQDSYVHLVFGAYYLKINDHEKARVSLTKSKMLGNNHYKLAELFEKLH